MNMQITVHLGLLALVMLCAFVAGLLFRILQVKALRRQILELESEKMQDHAEILQLQKKIADQQQSRTNPPAATPVVPLIEKESGQPDNGKNKRASQ